MQHGAQYARKDVAQIRQLLVRHRDGQVGRQRLLPALRSALRCFVNFCRPFDVGPSVSMSALRWDVGPSMSALQWDVGPSVTALRWFVKSLSVLQSLSDLYLTAKVLILLDNSYSSRFWTLFEAWSSMMTATADGVRTAEASERRFTIRCIHNADNEFDQPKLVKLLSTKTPQEMYAILAKPDVVVTNDRDKDMMLPVVSSTNEHVKNIFASMHRQSTE